MQTTTRRLEWFEKTLIGLVAVFAVFAGPALILLAMGNTVGAAVTGTLAACILVGISHLVAFGVGAAYTRSSMSAGADIALRAQETNDRWDERKTAAFGRRKLRFGLGEVDLDARDAAHQGRY